MTEEFENLSTDIEYMLQSDQVEDDTLIDELIKRFYQHIYLLSLSWLENPEEALRIAQETIATAVIQKRDFRGEFQVVEWLERIAAGICKPRIKYLEKGYHLNPNLVHSIRSQNSSRALAPHQIEHASQTIKARVKSKRSSKFKRGSFQILGISFIVVLVSYLLIYANYSVLVDSPSGNSSVPSQSHSQNEERQPSRQKEDSDPPQSAAVSDHYIQSSLFKPLSTGSPEDEILNRINESNDYWQSMWADFTVTFHGPGTYSGPAYSERHQFYIDQKRGGLLVSGPNTGSADYIEKIFITPYSSDGFSYSSLGSKYPWFSIKAETIFKFPFAMNLLFNHIERRMLANTKITIVGEEQWAARQALIVDQTTDDGEIIARLWIDNRTGVFLREQYFNPNLGEKVVIETSISEIDFDIPIPTMWQRPTNITQFPRRHIQPAEVKPEDPKSRVALPYPQAPLYYDSTRDQISFYKANDLDYDQNGLGDFFVVANNLSLGNLQLFDPLRMICVRSPDGNRLAYSTWNLLPTNEGSSIYWVDLSELSPIEISIDNTAVMRISFSPDGNTLVVIGIDQIQGQEKIYFVDLETGEIETMDIPPGYLNVAWSPTGDEFALMDWSVLPFGQQTEPVMLVYDYASKDQISEVIPDLDTPQESVVLVPLDGWTAEFHQEMQDLTQCTRPPG